MLRYKPVHTNQRSREYSETLTTHLSFRRLEYHRYAHLIITTLRIIIVTHSHSTMSSNRHIPGSGNPSYNQQPNYHANAQSPTMVHNSPFSHPPPYPLSGQQQSTLHVAASMHQNMMQPTTTTPTNVPDRQRQHRLTSTSEEEDETHLNSNNEWQVI